MRDWFRGKRGGLLGFLLVCTLVAGGLGWATRAALQLEQVQLTNQIAAEHTERVRLALWRLDSRISAIVAREDSRPFNHFSAIFAPSLALDATATPAPPGSVLEPSPLLNAELPSWMLLHFQIDERGWESPQVLSPTLRRWLGSRPGQVSLANVTPVRQQLVAELTRELPAALLLSQARKHAGDTIIRDRTLLARQQVEQAIANNSMQAQNDMENWREFSSRAGNSSKLHYSKPSEQRVSKDVALLSLCRNGEEWLHTYNYGNSNYVNPGPNPGGQGGGGGPMPQISNGPIGQPGNIGFIQNPGFGGRGNGRYEGPLQTLRLPVSSEVVVRMSPLVGVWMRTTTDSDRLVALRMVRLEEKDVCQGIVLDGERLQELLAEEVQDLFPGGSLQPAREPTPDELGRSMTALPLRLETGGPPTPDDPGWTPLRIGLSLAWAAAFLALVAVGLGGWSLLDLSERRIRFVSAVTHELRTPLTTLRLYLDMMLGGMITGEEKRNEYLRTLEAETDRLTRLVGNVLDYSRLESQRPALHQTDVTVADLLAQVQAAWGCRCGLAGKELLVEDHAPTAVLHTDVGLVMQILGNLLDNACKYSRDSSDRHVWLRARREGSRLFFEVEDRGPGVPMPERRLIFRPFHRGRAFDATTGGVGLGLALALRWLHMLGGRLTLHAPAEGGACFRVELPCRGGDGSALAGIPDEGGR